MIMPASGLFRKKFNMPAIRVKENEPFDVALRRFKRSCEKAGVLTDQSINTSESEVIEKEPMNFEQIVLFSQFIQKYKPIFVKEL